LKITSREGANCFDVFASGYPFFIDKLGSAKFPKAINSMFCWLSNAIKCFDYLLDPSPGSQLAQLLYESDFARDGWFTRGWTR
jgi:hypothetical protein